MQAEQEEESIGWGALDGEKKNTEQEERRRKCTAGKNKEGNRLQDRNEKCIKSRNNREKNKQLKGRQAYTPAVLAQSVTKDCLH